MTNSSAEEVASLAKPHKEHEWLQKFIGEWTFEGESSMGDESFKTSGEERVRKLGDLWIVAEGRDGDSDETLLTLGFDPAKGRYVGSWAGSMMPSYWVYDGELDASGKRLTLNSTGPAMSGAGTQLYRDIHEFESNDHRVLKAEVQDADGKWQHFMTTHYRRK